MNKTPGSIGSGDGTRPTTSGGTDNIGGGDRFTGHSSKASEENSAPAPAERMARKRKDVEASRHDDSAAFRLREDLRSETNQEPRKP